MSAALFNIMSFFSLMLITILKLHFYQNIAFSSYKLQLHFHSIISLTTRVCLLKFNYLLEEKNERFIEINHYEISFTSNLYFNKNTIKFY
jgi:hypothetical protein